MIHKSSVTLKLIKYSDTILLHKAVNPNPTWRFMGSYKWGDKSPDIGYKSSYPTYNPIYTYP